jgi:hypothetical protein
MQIPASAASRRAMRATLGAPGSDRRPRAIDGAKRPQWLYEVSAR